MLETSRYIFITHGFLTVAEIDPFRTSWFKSVGVELDLDN